MKGKHYFLKLTLFLVRVLKEFLLQGPCSTVQPLESEPNESYRLAFTPFLGQQLFGNLIDLLGAVECCLGGCLDCERGEVWQTELQRNCSGYLLLIEGAKHHLMAHGEQDLKKGFLIADIIGKRSFS
ncbi:hypothetical protein SDC9_86351 [bioreactor metagenome]|uniref:Uncharacterized protein n=1 Tax=bioreactor metagenome TaxID=1076179 RepID=A0A644ZG73_9ZZZZ